jgi:hypothetical protein
VGKIKVEVIIPITYGDDNTPLDSQVITEIHDEVIRVFHDGLSKDDSTLEGYWKENPNDKVYVKDKNKCVWAICNDTPENKKEIESLKLWLESKLRQKTIFMVVTQVKIVG